MQSTISQQTPLHFQDRYQWNEIWAMEIINENENIVNIKKYKYNK